MTDLVDLTSKTFGQAQWSLVVDMMQLELQTKSLVGTDRHMTDLVDLTSKTFGQAQWSLVMDMMQLELQKKTFGGN